MFIALDTSDMCVCQNILFLNVEQIVSVFTGRMPSTCEATKDSRIVKTPKPTAGTYHSSSSTSGSDSSSISNSNNSNNNNKNIDTPPDQSPNKF